VIHWGRMGKRRFESADAMLVFANVLWSLNYATTKYAFGEWLPLAFSFTRFAFAGVAFGFLVFLREGSLAIERSDWPRIIAAAGIGITLNQLTFNYALNYTGAGNVALILASAPAFAALFAAALRHEHVRRHHWAALLVSLMGVTLVVEGGSQIAGFTIKGDVLALGAAVTWAAYSVMLRPLFGRYSAARLSAVIILAGTVMLAPFAASQVLTQDYGSLSRLHIAAWVYSAVFPLLVTNLLYFHALRHIGAARATLYMYLQPFLGAAFAALLLGEKLSGLQVAGGVVIVGGVALGQWWGRVRVST
jgi:drug/metabolite transporter (DMT)-like permease